MPLRRSIYDGLSFGHTGGEKPRLSSASAGWPILRSVVCKERDSSLCQEAVAVRRVELEGETDVAVGDAGESGRDVAASPKLLDSEPAPARRPRTARRLWFAAASLGGLVIIAAMFVSARWAGSPPAVSQRPGPAPSFELENLHPGESPVTLDRLRGSPVVLNFWASWCSPCQREMPAFETVYEKVKGEVVFVGVDHQDVRRHALAVLSDTGVRYPSGYDPKGEVALDYGLFGMPSTVFISATGEILERRTGEMTGAELEQTIARLFTP